MTAIKMELTGGACWTFNLKLTFFFRLVRTRWTKTLYDKAIIDKILVGIDKMDRNNPLQSKI